MIEFSHPDTDSVSDHSPAHHFFTTCMDAIREAADKAPKDATEQAYSHLMDIFFSELAHEIGWVFASMADNAKEAADLFRDAINHSVALHQQDDDAALPN